MQEISKYNPDHTIIQHIYNLPVNFKMREKTLPNIEKKKQDRVTKETCIIPGSRIIYIYLTRRK